MSRKQNSKQSVPGVSFGDPPEPTDEAEFFGDPAHPTQAELDNAERIRQLRVEEVPDGTPPDADWDEIAQRMLDEAEQSDQPNEGNVSIDDIVAAFGAATLRAQKVEQLLMQKNNEIQRLRATLRNVLRGRKN